MHTVTRRSVMRGAAVVAPAVALSLPGPAVGLDAAQRGRGGCAANDQLGKLLKQDMSGKHAGRMHGVPLTYNWAKHPRVGVGIHPGGHGSPR
jgi:hypothetical protein